MPSKLSISILVLLWIGCCCCTTLPVTTDNSQTFYCSQSPNCLFCIGDFYYQEKCITCYPGFTFQDNKCVLDENYCYTQDGSKCTLPYCQYEVVETSGLRTCSRCLERYSLESSESGGQQCKYYCSQLSRYVTDAKDCYSNCTNTPNCSTCQKSNPDSCESCIAAYNLQKQFTSYPSFKFICVAYCKSGYYANSKNECVRCPSFCKECTSDTVCTSCNEVALSTPAPSCQCPPGSYYFDNHCIKETPLNYLLINEQYQRICQDGYYPLNKNDGSIVCTNGREIRASDDYCVGNLFLLKQLISFESAAQTDTDYFLFNVKLTETPKICYDFDVTGLTNYSLQYMINQLNNDYSSPNDYYFQVLVRKNEFQDSTRVACTQDSCKIFLNVRWNGQTQLIYAINLSLSLKYVLSNTLTYTSSADQIDVICEQCEIPQELKISSVLSINCQEGQTCSGDSMQVKSGSLIQVTQTVSDDSLKSHTLLPHSLVLTGYSNLDNIYYGNTFTYYIKEYKFDNSIPGQITYSFNAISYPKIDVVITSYFNKKITPTGRRMLATSSDTVNYPQMRFQVKVVTPPSEEDSKLGVYIGIGVGVGSFVVLLGVGLLFYIRRLKKLAKNATQLPTKEIIYRTEDQDLKLEDAKRFERETIEANSLEK